MKNKLGSVCLRALVAGGIGVTALSLAPNVNADPWDKQTIVTIREPLIAGNKVLEPGTYVWKLLNSSSDRHIVQIFDKDQRHLEETILAIPNWRLQPTGDTQFAYWETPAGVPKAVRAWFYPGDNSGQEFRYPKRLIAQLASAVPTPLPMAEERAPASAAEPAPAAAAGEPEPKPTPTPSEEPTAAPVQPVESTSATVPVAGTPTALPHTASNAPLIGLAGFGALALAGLISSRRKLA